MAADGIERRRSMKRQKGTFFRDLLRGTRRQQVGLSELVDDIPQYEQGRFHKLVAQIHGIYEASVDLFKTDSNGQETAAWALWQDYFSRMADRLSRKANDFQKREDERNARSVPTMKEETSVLVDKEGASGPAASSSQEPELLERKTKRVLLLPVFPTVLPVSEEEHVLVAARRVEREEVEKRLAERAANLTELFKHFTAEPTHFFWAGEGARAISNQPDTPESKTAFKQATNPIPPPPLTQL